MKNHSIFLLAAAITLTSAGFTQSKNDQIVIPSFVKQAFAKNFPGVKAKWGKEESNYEAEFVQKGHEMSAVFEANGKMTETETEIKEKELPAGVIAYVKDHYNGTTIQEAAKITKTGGEINYEAEVRGSDLIFDSNGRFIRKEGK